MKHVLVTDVVHRRGLAGYRNGEADLPRLKSTCSSLRSGELVVLDLAGIEVVTSSYFIACLWPLWAAARAAEDSYFPVAANVPADFLDDVRLPVSAKHAALWMVRFEGGAVFHPEAVGEVDKEMAELLDLAVSRGHLTASDLFALDPRIKMTAWSNRLAGLFQHRLLRRRKDGRRLIYAPPWVEE